MATATAHTTSIGDDRRRHPAHQIPDGIAEALHAFQAGRQAELNRQQTIAAVARPTVDERKMAAALRPRPATAGDDERAAELRAVGQRRFDRVVDALRFDASTVSAVYDFLPIEPDLFADAPTDHSFWWAETRWFVPPSVRPEWRSDGLHFFGGPTHHSGDLFNTNFGAVSFFELQPERIPHSPSGRRVSAPHVELFGGLLGYTGDDDITTGDLWAKCWMHRRQTLLQFHFGPTGPVPVVVGEAREHQSLIFEENRDRAVHVDLPGFQWMPPVTFGNVHTGLSLWAHLEVRFDIQLEGAGTLLWADPEVLLRGFQWPLAAL